MFKALDAEVNSAAVTFLGLSCDRSHRHTLYPESRVRADFYVLTVYSFQVIAFSGRQPVYLIQA